MPQRVICGGFGIDEPGSLFTRFKDPFSRVRRAAWQVIVLLRVRISVALPSQTSAATPETCGQVSRRPPRSPGPRRSHCMRRRKPARGPLRPRWPGPCSRRSCSPAEAHRADFFSVPDTPIDAADDPTRQTDPAIPEPLHAPEVRLRGDTDDVGIVVDGGHDPGRSNGRVPVIRAAAADANAGITAYRNGDGSARTRYPEGLARAVERRSTGTEARATATTVNLTTDR